MSLARRLMSSVFTVTAPGVTAAQVEYGPEAGVYLLQVPDDVEFMSGVVIAAGKPGSTTSPFPGGRAGNLHWRNAIPVVPGEWLEIKVGNGERNAPSVGGQPGSNSHVRRLSDSTFLLRAQNGTTLYHTTLGGGGGLGGNSGPGAPGNGGMGGGGPGYEGAGGSGGNYLDTTSGQFPQTDSGGGRGGDANGVPTGYSGSEGEGTGLFGRSADKTTSLGPKLFGAGAFATAAEGRPGGIRLIWGDDRSYPDNPPDRASAEAATFISTANGTQNNSSPIPFTFHTSAAEGDLLLVWPTLQGSGSFGGFAGISNMNQAGVVYWKQITAADIAASIDGTTTILGSGDRSWVTATYRGARVAVQRAVGVNASGTVTVPGVTKRIDSKRLVLTVSDQDAAAVIPTPAGFTSRASRTTPMDMRLSDAAPTDYTNGTAIVMTGLDATTGTAAYLLELY